jgi:phosphate transport system permease protein
MRKFKEKLSGRIFFIFALTSVTALAVITLFIFREGVPMLGQVLGSTWAPGNEQFGIFPMIAGTVAVLGAALIGVPIGICCAIFMAEFAPEKMRNIFRPAIQLLAGIPSVVYGFWGLLYRAFDYDIADYHKHF